MASLRAIYSCTRFREREFRGWLLRKLGLQNKLWAFGLFDEYQFWERTLSTQGANWDPKSFKERLDPGFPLEEELRALIPAPAGATVRILDVGAGPLTTVGKVWEGRTVEVIPVDPLANQYSVLLKRLSITAPAPTVQAEGEKLLEQFGTDTFDLTNSRNALDHCYDPLVVIRQMVQVCKPGGYTYLYHIANVADMEHHKGLHQWNFDIKGDDTVLSGSSKAYSLKKELSDLATLECGLDTSTGWNVVISKFRKHGGAASA